MTVTIVSVQSTAKAVPSAPFHEISGQMMIRLKIEAVINTLL